MKVTGTQILLYTETGKLSFEVSASLSQTNSVYELLPNSYSRKREYGIADWSIDGEFFYEQQGNYNYIADKVKNKEKVAIIIVEETVQVRFGYGVIENVTYNALNEQTVSFNATILGTSALSQFPESIFFLPHVGAIFKIFDNTAYSLSFNQTDDNSFQVIGSSGLETLFTYPYDGFPRNFIKIDEDFYVLERTTNKLKKFKKNGYLSAEASLSSIHIDPLRKLFDSLGDYIGLANDSVGAVLSIRKLSDLSVYKTLTDTENIVDFVQLSNGNILYLTNAKLVEKTFDNVQVESVTLSGGTYEKLFQSSLNDLYLVDQTTATSTYNFRYIEDYDGTITSVTLLETTEPIRQIFELESNIIIVCLDNDTFYLFKGKEQIADPIVSGLSISDNKRELVIDSNGCVYHTSQGAVARVAIPISLSGVDSYDMPIFKLI